MLFSSVYLMGLGLSNALIYLMSRC